MQCIKSFFTVTFVFVLSQVFGQTTRPTTQPVSKVPNEIRKKTDVYEITYPIEWELDETGARGTTFILNSPLISAEDEFRESVTYMVQDATGFNLDLDSFTKLSVDQIESLFPNSHIISNKAEKDKNGNTYQRLEYTGDQGWHTLHFIQHYYFSNDKAEIITFVAEQNQFRNYEDVAERIISSILRK